MTKCQISKQRLYLPTQELTRLLSLAPGFLTPLVLVRVLETLVPRQSDEQEDDDFLLDRLEVRVTVSLAEVREPICRMIVAAVHRRTIALLRTTVIVEFFKLVFI